MATKFGHKHKSYSDMKKASSRKLPPADPTGRNDRVYEYTSEMGTHWKFNVDEALRRFPNEHPFDVFEREMHAQGMVLVLTHGEDAPETQDCVDVTVHLMRLERIKL